MLEDPLEAAGITQLSTLESKRAPWSNSGMTAVPTKRILIGFKACSPGGNFFHAWCYNSGQNMTGDG